MSDHHCLSVCIQCDVLFVCFIYSFSSHIAPPQTTLALQVAAVVASGVAAPSTSSSNTPHAAQTVLFIDSEGSFVPSRCEEIIRALQREAAVDAHTAAKQAESGGAAAAAAAATAACDAAMRRVLVQRCHSHSELLCALFALRNNVRRANVSTVIVDSVSAVLRHGSQHGGQHPAARSHTYARVFNLLAQLASECHVAMLVCNQLTTKVLGGDVGEGAGGGVAAAAVAGAATRTVMVPALGELWGHFCHTRLRLKNYTLSISAAAAAAAGVDRDGDGGGGGDVGGAGGYDDDDADAVMSSPSANAASALMRSTSALPPRLRFVRTATLVKSPNQAESSVSFAITASGLR